MIAEVLGPSLDEVWAQVDPRRRVACGLRRGRHPAILMAMDRADDIWNRATTGGGPTAREGDLALSAALLFHGAVMGGGVLHAYETLTADELQRARDGFVWLALSDVARFVEETAQSIAGTDWDDHEAAGALEASTDEAYDALVPDDEILDAAFRARLAEKPKAFAPT